MIHEGPLHVAQLACDSCKADTIGMFDIDLPESNLICGSCHSPYVTVTRYFGPFEAQAGVTEAGRVGNLTRYLGIDPDVGDAVDALFEEES